MAGTIFQDSKVPLTVWFRAMWQVTGQKHGISALGLQRVLGLGSYRSAWAMVHELRRAMVRPGREKLRGTIEVDETYWGAPGEGASGRRTFTKALVAIAAEAVPDTDRAVGRVRLARISDITRASLHGFIRESIEPGSTVVTDGLQAYRSMNAYRHERRVQVSQDAGEEQLLPRVHRVASLLKRWLLGTHHGAIGHAHVDDYLNEFTFRFNRRTSASRGKFFYRLAQQAVQVDPAPYDTLITSERQP